MIRSSTSRKLLAVMVVLMWAIPASPARAQGPDDPPLATLFDQVGQAIGTAVQTARDRAELNARFAMAREAFFRAYRTGTDREQAENTFGDLLLAKDIYYLGLYVGVGPNSRHPEGLEALTGGTLDGGIRPSARAHFSAWLNRVRQELGASHPDQVLFVWSEVRLRAAVNAAEAEFLRYKAARDRAEFEERGIQTGDRVIGHRTLSEPGRQATTPRQTTGPNPTPATPATPANPTTPAARPEAAERRAGGAGDAQPYLEEMFVRRYGGEEQGRQARYGFSAAFTVRRFEEAARVIFAAPKDADGRLTDPTALGLPPETRDPYEALEALLLREHPAPYVLEWLRDGDPQIGSIADAGHAWSRLISTYSEPVVLATARAIHAAARAPAAGGVVRVADPSALGGWSERPDRLLREVLAFGSAERFLATLVAYRANSTSPLQDRHQIRAELVRQHGEEALLRAAEALRRSLIEGAGRSGPGEVTEEVYQRFLSALETASGMLGSRSTPPEHPAWSGRTVSRAPSAYRPMSTQLEQGLRSRSEPGEAHAEGICSRPTVGAGSENDRGRMAGTEGPAATAAPEVSSVAVRAVVSVPLVPGPCSVASRARCRRYASRHTRGTAAHAGCDDGCRDGFSQCRWRAPARKRGALPR